VTHDPGTLDIHIGAIRDTESWGCFNPNESSLKDRKNGYIKSSSVPKKAAFEGGEETLKMNPFEKGDESIVSILGFSTTRSCAVRPSRSFTSASRSTVPLEGPPAEIGYILAWLKSKDPASFPRAR